MPKNYLVLLLLLVSGLMRLAAQPCVVSSTATYPVVLPNDTIEIDGANPGADVYQLVLRRDTIWQGFLIRADSLKITGIAGLPGTMSVATHTGTPQASVWPDSTQQFRTCLTIFHPSVMGYSPNYPACQTLEVYEFVHVTLPFTAILYYLDTLRIPYRIHNGDSVVDAVQRGTSLGMHLFPNPATARVNLAYSLPEAADVTVSISDLVGHCLQETTLGWQESGQQTLSLDVMPLPAGLYFVCLQAGDRRVSRCLMRD